MPKTRTFHTRSSELARSSTASFSANSKYVAPSCSNTTWKCGVAASGVARGVMTAK